MEKNVLDKKIFEIVEMGIVKIAQEKQLSVFEIKKFVGKVSYLENKDKLIKNILENARD